MFSFLKWIKEHNINPFHAKVPFLYRQSKGFLTFSGDIEMGHCWHEKGYLFDNIHVLKIQYIITIFLKFLWAQQSGNAKNEVIELMTYI